MIIQHNMASANTNRQLGITNSNLQKSTEKLSSGYRINRAGDDAAGLSISEKMRGQIRGLNQASTNAQDGISLIQTAEGAMNEIHSIIQRMRELTVQASNDTNVEEDREAIQDEIDQLTNEIDRIADSTEFNTMKIINGDFSGEKDDDGNLVTKELTLQVGANNSSVYPKNEDGDVVIDPDDNGYVAPSEQVIKFTIGSMKTTAIGKAADPNADEAVGMTIADLTKIYGTVLDEDGIPVEDDEGNEVLGAASSDQIAKNLDILDEALKYVSKERSNLGSIQNRLEHTIANADNTAENLQSAESRIRDVDMAEEMVGYSKDSILQQAAQSMLAQANQSTQGVLSLLQ